MTPDQQSALLGLVASARDDAIQTINRLTIGTHHEDPGISMEDQRDMGDAEERLRLWDGVMDALHQDWNQ